MEPIKKNPMFMWRNRDNVMELFKKSKKKYDWVISTRLDVYYDEKLNFNKLSRDKINIPLLADYGGYQDKIAIGKKNIMARIGILERLYTLVLVKAIFKAHQFNYA